MQVVFDFVQGKLSYDEFEIELILHPEIWSWIQGLVPKDIDDVSCKFRLLYGNMSGFETNNYNVRSTIMAFDYDKNYVQITSYSLISTLIKYHYPNIVCQPPPEESCYDLLDSIGLDFIGGNEVDDIIRETILKNRDKSKKEIKKALKNAFFICTRKFPHWVQEPEWPICNGIPMQFVSESSEGDKFIYEFQDVNSKEIKIVTQYA